MSGNDTQERSPEGAAGSRSENGRGRGPRRSAEGGGPGGGRGPGGGGRGPGGGGRGPGGGGRGPGGGGRGPGGGGRGPGGGGRGPGGGRDGRGRGRGRDRDEGGGRGRNVARLRDLITQVDRPLVKGDFAGQLAPLDQMRRLFEDTGLKSLDEMGTDLKARTLTLLLRVGRQVKAKDDPEQEAARLKVHEALARVWLAAHDERRAAAALASAGKEKAAAALLKDSGDWEARVELYRATGETAKAAQTLEGHGDLAAAAELYEEAKDHTNRVRVLHQLGDEAGVVATLHLMPPEEAEQLAGRYGALDAWAKVLTEKQDWPSLARLYEAHDQPAIAARAWEEAGDHAKAMRAYARAGDAEGHARTVDKVVEQRLEKHDVLGAAKSLASVGKLERAAELASEKHPEQAHRWFVEGGYLDRALQLARHEARKAEGHDDFRLRATWLERAGDFVSAATLLEGLGQVDRAQALYEQAKAWEPAARCAEAQSKMDEAVELYYRAGLSEEAERVKLLA